MLKLLDKYTAMDGSTVEIFQTSHSGDDYHVRYGLQVKGYILYGAALIEFNMCCNHARQCCGLRD